MMNLIPLLASLTALMELPDSHRPRQSADNLIRPVPREGQVLSSIFSKTIAIEGVGFDPFVRRVSGTATDVITAVEPDATSEAETYHYDGTPPGTAHVVIRDGGATSCVDGKCRANDQTSSALFNPLLWGRVPRRLVQGATWMADLAAWEIGPAGRERVSVVRVHASAGLVSLQRIGSGSGASSDDAGARPITIVVGGKAMSVRIEPGDARWSGYATVVRGITLADQVTVEREVVLVAGDGQRFKGRERIYTIFAEAAASPLERPAKLPVRRHEDRGVAKKLPRLHEGALA